MLKINQITFDAHQPDAVAAFWSAAMGFAENPDDPNLPEHDEAAIFSPDHSQVLLFIRVPEGKTLKNRVHLDVASTDLTRDEEVQRMLGLGASVYDDRRQPDGKGWVVMQDPEGNEFCIERSQSERTAD
jgi:catechol 2,3-dioxygenase-like lactoylglutathione lyase family enzyme